MIDNTAELGLRIAQTSVSTADVELLVAALRSMERWVTAGDLAVHLGAGYSDRKVRAIAAAAVPQIVSYPGSPGYKLWQFCSVAEIDHCIEAFESQGSDMIKRAVLYRQAYHRRFRGQPVQS
jgi:hypothetical protein